MTLVALADLAERAAELALARPGEAVELFKQVLAAGAS